LAAQPLTFMSGTTIVFLVLLATLAMFVWGRWRYDLVAMAALLLLVVLGQVDPGQAFSGFGHPAVITVAAVLVLSRGLRNSGLVDLLARLVFKVGDSPTAQVAALTLVCAVSSAFMNNVGALALLMPVGIQLARQSGRSPSFLLMPLAFGSLLGGLTTLIGTPPNIIIGTFRARVAEEPFRMFDFSPVGVPIALAGIVFLALVGWRLIPERKGRASREEMFHIKEYLTEARVPEDSPSVGKSLREVEKAGEGEVTILGLVRNKKRYLAISPLEVLRAEDILMLQGDSAALRSVVDKAKLELVGDEPISEEKLGSEAVSLVEAVVGADSSIVGRTAVSMNLRWRHGVNLLAVARQGDRIRDRLDRIRFQSGDVLLLQGSEDTLLEVLPDLGLLPLAERSLQLDKPKRVLFSVAIFAAAVVLGTLQIVPTEVAFVGAVLVMVLLNFLSLRDVYQAVDWPVIVLLAAMIPVGGAMETSGGAALLAGMLLKMGNSFPLLLSLAVLMVATMFLSDIINNAAAAILMAPIAVSLASGLGTSADPFLMGIAVAASAAFLTPIGHQSNTLVYGPGGYKFGDYWRVGLPLEAVILALSLVLIPWAWPF
jgi:di/tricarboxylate transporter